MQLQRKKWTPIIIGLSLTALFALAACMGGLPGNSGSGEQKEVTADSTLRSGKFKCPLDGAALQELPEDRPVAVIIDNLPKARPQAGLKNADLVVETLAEGGVTRFLAVYYHGQASKVGPIRSARPYFIDLARGLDAVLVHAGGSPEALDYMKRHDFPHLNEFNHADSFWRSRERQAPHNLYSSTSNLHSLAREVGLNSEFQVRGFSFAGDAASIAGDKGLRSSKITIDFPKGYDVAYSYDSGEQVYSRYTDGKAHLDELTNSQLSPRNIIVKFVKTRIIDAQGRLKIDISGHGRALIFSQGYVIEALWQDSAGDEVFSYKTVEGKSVKLTPGQVWVEIVPETAQVTF